MGQYTVFVHTIAFVLTLTPPLDWAVRGGILADEMGNALSLFAYVTRESQQGCDVDCRAWEVN
jgi:hypothetical protein